MLDTTIADRFINTGNAEEFKNHWVFSRIFDLNLRKENAFCAQDPSKAETAGKTRDKLKAVYDDFRPFNYGCVEKLFPGFLQTLKEARIALIVGAPEPYDAFVRNYAGTDYIFFDALNTAGYTEEAFRSVLTHEIIHLRIHERFPVPENGSFREILAYVLFDESFAHCLSYGENVALCDFTDKKERYYEKAVRKLQNAPFSGNAETQASFLEHGTSGNFWDKFIPIAGMFYLNCHSGNLEQIFQRGPDAFLSVVMKTRAF